VAVRTLLTALANEDQSPIDAVFVLGKGAAINFGDGRGMQRLDVAGRPVKGWAWLEDVPVLVQLLGWLHGLPIVVRDSSPFAEYLNEARTGMPVQLPPAGDSPDGESDDGSSTASTATGFGRHHPTRNPRLRRRGV